MVKTKSDERITIFQSFVCGGTAGFISKSVIAPLDYVKVHRQVGTPGTSNGLLNTVITLYRKEGLRSFWKGNLIGCLRLVPHSMIQLAAYQRLKLKLADDCGRLTPWTAAVAGAGGGVIATAALYPTDTVKSRLIVQPSDPGLKHYKGINHAFATIAQKEGILALYRGLSAATVLGVIPFVGATFLAYEISTPLYRKADLQPDSHSVALVHGALTTLFAQFASFPFDTIRKKMQCWSTVLPASGGVDVCARTVRLAFHETLHQKGIMGLWNGYIPNALKIFPYTLLLIVTYQGCKNMFLYQNGYTLSPFRDVPRHNVDQTLTVEELHEMWQVQGLNDDAVVYRDDSDDVLFLFSH